MITVIFGWSDAGKDTVADIMAEDLPRVFKVKWSLPMKQWVCQVYGCTLEQLEDKAFRSTLVPGMDINWHELMLRCYVHLRAIDPDIMVRQITPQLETALEHNRHLVFTDTRTTDELKVILELADAYEVPCMAIWVDSPRAYQKLADKDSRGLFNQLRHESDWDIATIDNSGTIEQLKELVRLCY